MLSTRDTIRLLREANPGHDITEDRLRHALRRGLLERPPIFAGRLIWSEEHVLALAAALGIKAPDFSSTEDEVEP